MTIETTDCTRYACLILRNVTRSDSEPWMQARLRQAGMRPISLMVDITNYVMLEVGQPLHAFDYDKLIGGRIVVRKARPGEKLTTLNGIEHDLQPDQMMICDAERPVAAAGIMGGLDTEVGPDTKTILLESAHFGNKSVRRTRKQLGLSTEASYRFERSVDPEGVVTAINRCMALLLAADPGVVGTDIVDAYPTKPNVSEIDLRVSRASKLLGMPITHGEAQSYLSRLGFKPETISDDTFRVKLPTWRPDIVREVDLVEELGRVHGYDKIPERLLEGTTTMGGPQGFQLWTDWLREAAVRSGLTQIISHSLRDLHPLDEPGAGRIGPRTPSSPEMAYLRSSLLPSLADAARRNNPKDIHIFELGHVFRGQSGGHEDMPINLTTFTGSASPPLPVRHRASDSPTSPTEGRGEGFELAPGLQLSAIGYEETIRLGILTVGPQLPMAWSSSEASSSGFFTLKGRLEAAFGEVGVNLSFMTPLEIDPRLHPSRQASIFAGDRLIGFLGQLHPDAASATGLAPDTVVAEVSIAEAYAGRSLNLDLHGVSRHPAVRRDMSVLGREVGDL